MLLECVRSKSSFAETCVLGCPGVFDEVALENSGFKYCWVDSLTV